MEVILRITLKGIMLATLAASTVVCFWFLFWVVWLASTYVTPDQGLNQVFTEVPEALVREHGISGEEIARAKALFEGRSLFAAIAGLWGWIALYAGAFLMNRPFRKVPLSIKSGLVAGVLASIAMPSAGITLAIYPIITAMLLLAIWWLNSFDEQSGRM